MQIILLLNDSDEYLWPLCNNARPKQLIKMLNGPNGAKESILQRFLRKIQELKNNDYSVSIVSTESQKKLITDQVGSNIDIIVEAENKGLFSLISLVCSYLKYEKLCSDGEVVIVMPCNFILESEYFNFFEKMKKIVEYNFSDLLFLGVKASYPSERYEYIVPKDYYNHEGIYGIDRILKKNELEEQTLLAAENLFWNVGIFAFKLNYVSRKLKKYIKAKDYIQFRLMYKDFPEVSFRREFIDKATSLALLPFYGKWKELGTWNNVTDELSGCFFGNVITDDTIKGSYVINELDIPLFCLGTENLIIVASYDGILISEKGKSERLKKYVIKTLQRPMYEERQWGYYKVIHTMNFEDGFKSLTKQLTVRAGKSISYQLHYYRDEVWTFLDGEGLLILDGVINHIGRGDTICIKKGVKHTVKAITELTFIEVQSGTLLSEDDIERFEWEW